MHRQGEILTITQEALERIRAFRQMSGDPGAAVRITLHPEAPVEGKYELQFVSRQSAKAADVTVQFEDILILLDPRSADLLAGTLIDYKEGMWSSGFHFENPNRMALIADPLGSRIQEIIERRVIPMVAAHGGTVSLVDVRERRAYVQFGGGCQGCGLAPQTLKHGVVELLRHEVPEIVEVVDVTDHAAGEKPYYPAG